MARVKYYDQASQEWKYADAALNMKGKDGYTPVKGTDYFTDEDKQELTEKIMGQGVLTYNEQILTEEQKAQARENIGINRISMDQLTENLDANGFRITNLPLPENGSEPATKEFVENFTIEGSTYVATDDGEGNITIRPYLADEDELVFKSHIQNRENPHGVTAAQIGARPADWTPTAVDVGAATPNDVNAAKTEVVTEARTYTDQQMKKAAPRNLLDNSNFTNPINQRNFVSGSEVQPYTYFLDRWKATGNTVYPTFGLDGIGNLSNDIAQIVDLTEYIGKKMTFVMYSDYEMIACFATGTITSNDGWAANMIGPNWDCSITSVSTNRWSCNFRIPCKYVALYEGEYTADTIPKYIPKGYQAELAECQRYLYFIRSTNDNQIIGTFVANANKDMAWGNIWVPTSMRTTPTITTYGSLKYFEGDSWVQKTPEQIQIRGSFDNSNSFTLGVKFASTVLTAAKPGFLQFGTAGSFIAFVAEL